MEKKGSQELIWNRIMDTEKDIKLEFMFDKALSTRQVKVFKYLESNSLEILRIYLSVSVIYIYSLGFIDLAL